MKLYQMWVPLLIASTLINLISIKGFPLALGTLYLPILFKVVKMQMNLSNGLFDEDVNANVFIHNNQKGIVISVLCCIAVTVALFIYLKDFYASLSGILVFFIMLSPITLALGLILYILTAVAIVQATKHKFTS